MLELRRLGKKRSWGPQEWYPGWHMNGSYEHKHEDIDVNDGKPFRLITLWQYGASLELVARRIPLLRPQRRSEGIMGPCHQKTSHGVARRLLNRAPVPCWWFSPISGIMVYCLQWHRPVDDLWCAHMAHERVCVGQNLRILNFRLWGSRRPFSQSNSL